MMSVRSTDDAHPHAEPADAAPAHSRRAHWPGAVLLHGPSPRRARITAWWLAAWSLAYAAYRGYYAAGGRFAMIGQPISQSQFQQINGVGAVIIVVFSVLAPLLMVHVGVLRRLLPAAGWIGAVGCCMHALVDMTLRVFSLTGIQPSRLPSTFWQSYDRHNSDLQDLLLNEPWFLINGLLWGALALALLPRAKARWWLISAVITCAALTTYGVLRGVDIIGHTFLG